LLSTKKSGRASKAKARRIQLTNGSNAKKNIEISKQREI
jgi:hypothetical protein